MKKVFVIGAGFNCFLKKKINGKLIPPPVSKNFFRYCLERGNPDTVYGITTKVLKYIAYNFNLTKSDLLHEDFDLEFFLSFIETKLNQAKQVGNTNVIHDLEEVRLNVMVAISEVFFDLEWKPPQGYELLKKFGKMIYETKSDVITFNYDCLIECGIERASGKRARNHRQNGSPYFNWDRYSAYGIKFTKIRTGGWLGYYDANDGINIARKFYENYHNSSPDFSFIKLHGSNNWFRYSTLLTNKKVFDNLFEKNEEWYVRGPALPKSLKNELICFNGDWQFGHIPTWNKHTVNANLRYRNVLEPIIIPPTQEKDKEFKQKIFQKLWRDAKEVLLRCNEVVIIGYSFPDTDFASKQLFIEAFSENEGVNVTFVNPDSSVIDKFRGLVNFKKKIKHYNDSGAYIKGLE